jgi:hypothetical protein
VGTSAHKLKISFHGTRISIYWDDLSKPLIDLTDNNFDNSGPYTKGSISIDTWAFALAQGIRVDDVTVTQP